MRYLREHGEIRNQRGSQQKIRDENLKWIFRLLYKHCELSRSDLTRMTGLSPTTVSALVDVLIKEHLALEAGYAQTIATGRKPINLQICGSGRQIPVFTLGRKSVRYTLYNLQLDVLESMVIPMDSMRCWNRDDSAREGFPDVGREYAELIVRVLTGRSLRFSRERALALCITYPGRQEADGSLVMPGMRASIRPEHFYRLEDELRLPLFLGGVAQAMAYAEKRYLELENGDDEDLVYIAVRDSVGLGTAGREMDDRAERCCSEFGHMTVNYRGRTCYCGRKGCLEQYVSVDAIIARIEQAASFHPCEMLPADADRITLDMIGRAYDAGERGVAIAMNEVAEQLYAGIHNAVCFTGIRRVFLGGGIERLGPGFLECIRMYAANTDGLLGLQPEIAYGHIAIEDAGRGIARYYIENVYQPGKRFES